MKFPAGILLAVLIVSPSPAPAQWSPAQKIFSTPATRIHPAFRQITHPQWGYGAEEQLVFTLVTGPGSRICLLNTLHGGTSWGDSVQDLTGDSAWNDNATFARSNFNGLDSTMMILWQRGGDDMSIWYRYNPDTMWLPEARLTGQTEFGCHPHVSAVDSGYYAVWESHGRIVFASFRQGAWSNPEFVTSEGDTGNHNPQVGGYYVWGGGIGPLVVWEQVSRPPDTCAVVYSSRRSSGWSSPDTIGWSGDNRRPRFSTPGSPIAGWMDVSYESNWKGAWEIFGAHAWGVDTTGVIWSDRDKLVSDEASPGVDRHDATLFMVPIIVTRPAGLSFFPDLAGVWTEESGGESRIALPLYAGPVRHESIAPGSVNGNPTLSAGMMRGGVIRVIAVWENNATGSRDLYSSMVDLDLGVEPERPGLPSVFELRQNYPNPFNPATRIKYQLPYKEFVTVKVYDMLGREVATLVNEEKTAGHYSATWNAQGKASGMYICQMKAGKFVAARKVLLIR